jgi:polyhydroxyalkanoate synthesis regulator phasin
MEKHYYCDIRNANDREVMQHLIDKVVKETGIDEEQAYKLVDYIIVTYRNYPEDK